MRDLASMGFTSNLHFPSLSAAKHADRQEDSPVGIATKIKARKKSKPMEERTALKQDQVEAVFVLSISFSLYKIEAYGRAR